MSKLIKELECKFSKMEAKIEMKTKNVDKICIEETESLDKKFMFLDYEIK